jgi:hypothetical protein
LLQTLRAVLSVGGATITLVDKATSVPRTTASNEAGRYLFANVPPGSYEVTANKTGFRSPKVSEISVTVVHATDAFHLHQVE